MYRRLTGLMAFGAAAVALTAGQTQAGLQASYTFVGKGNWSLNAIGNNNNPTLGNIVINVPVGSTIEKAFLYSTTFSNNGVFTPSVTLGATNYSGGQFTPLGVSGPLSLQAFRADVTAQVAGVVNGGPGGNYSFAVSEAPAQNGSIDGEVLAVVYSNPAEQTRSIFLLDGFTAPTGTTTTVNYASGLPDPITTPGFEALMSLGIGFGFQGTGQFSNVDINGRRLTSSAGGQDDGIAANGGLVTVGGIGDLSANPVNPNAGPVNERSDDELYNLALGNGVNPAPFLAAGQTQTTIFTTNPSQDDNIFFLGLNITAIASVNQTGVVPAPAALVLGLIGAGAAGFGIRRRRTAA